VTVSLIPEEDVETRRQGFQALSPRPWLRVEAGRALAGGRFVEIIYTASFWDIPVRPVFRFCLQDGLRETSREEAFIDRLAPGPVAGKGLWCGFVPENCDGLLISPTNRPGPFDFRILSIRVISLPEMFRGAWIRDPRRAGTALLRQLVGQRQRAAAVLEESSVLPLAQSRSWLAERVRPFEVGGLDHPRFDWNNGLSIHIVLSPGKGNKAALATSIEALRKQVYPLWTLTLLFPDGEDSGPLPASEDPRINVLARCLLPDLFATLPAADLVIEMEAGDEWMDHGLACFAEAAIRHPEVKLFYGDEENESGHVLLKPGWSPHFFANGPFLGRAFATRVETLRQSLQKDEGRDRELLAGSPFGRDWLHALSGAEILPLHRILLRRNDEGFPEEAVRLEEGEKSLAGRPAIVLPQDNGLADELEERETNPSVMIILPVRDGAEKLSRSIASIYEHTAFDNYSILIVDDESVEDDTKHLFELVRKDRLISVLHNPGGVGIAALCNAAAARRRADMIVFLDNGAEILDSDWLDRLLTLAIQPDIGAIGVRLLTPSGAVLPSSFILGASAGRVDVAGETRADDVPENRLWQVRARRLHEAAAVGGGCFAVARRKFMLTGGFAPSPVLPPNLRESDLCLRLAAKGYRAILDPSIRLQLNAPRASSGSAGEEWFARQWFDVWRDDPCFHPGLTLNGALALE